MDVDAKWATNGKRTFRALPSRFLRARFDSAATTANNRRHWANADSLSADAAASADVRKTLRERARYEVANNSYAKGIVLTLANDTVGTGPRLQMLTPNDQVNRRLEREFELWAHRVGCDTSSSRGGEWTNSEQSMNPWR